MRCGWNREWAYRRVQQLVRVYGISILVGPLAVILDGWFYERSGKWIAAGAGCIGLFALFSYLSVRNEFQKFQSAAAPRGLRVKPVSSSHFVQPENPSKESSEPLDVTGATVFYQGKEIPSGWPRSVRLPRKAKWMYGFLYGVIAWLEAVFVYLIYERWEGLRESGELPWGILMLLGMAAFVAICGWLLPRKLRRHRKLLTTGEISLGRVSGQRIKQAGDTSENRITYRYKDKTGRILTGEDRDQTENFYEGMVVPVVCERDNPANHLALCATDYEVLEAYPME